MLTARISPAPSIRRAMAVRAKKPQIADRIVSRVAVYVVNLKSYLQSVPLFDATNIALVVMPSVPQGPSYLKPFVGACLSVGHMVENLSDGHLADFPFGLQPPSLYRQAISSLGKSMLCRALPDGHAPIQVVLHACPIVPKLPSLAQANSFCVIRYCGGRAAHYRNDALIGSSVFQHFNDLSFHALKVAQNRTQTSPTN
jgi:hypothetical protein